MQINQSSNPLKTFMDRNKYGFEELAASSGLQSIIIESIAESDTMPNVGLLSILDIAANRPNGSFQKDFQKWFNTSNN